MPRCPLTMAIVRRLGAADLDLLVRAQGVFDEAVRPDMALRFLSHPDHHLFAAVVGDTLVGFASAITYLHPDKPLEYWINEVGVHELWQRQGIGRQLVRAALDHGRALGCSNAWVITNSGNEAALALYAACGGTFSPTGGDPDTVVMVEFGAGD